MSNNIRRKKKPTVNVYVKGTIVDENGDNVDLALYMDKYIKFLEQNGWKFDGVHRQVDKMGNPIIFPQLTNTMCVL